MTTQWFLSLTDAQQQLDRWREEYNLSRPHRALNDQPPTEFASNYAERDRVEEVKTANELALQMA